MRLAFWRRVPTIQAIESPALPPPCKLELNALGGVLIEGHTFDGNKPCPNCGTTIHTINTLTMRDYL
jgi:hypothetical protein